MARSNLNGMTTSERVTYSHGKIKSDMHTFRQQIYDMHGIAMVERSLLFILDAVFAVIVLSAFYFLQPANWIELALLGIIAAVFTVSRFMSHGAVRRQLIALAGLQFLYSKLADDETIRLVTEALLAEEIEIERVYLSGLTDERVRDGLTIAGYVLDTIVKQIGPSDGEPKRESYIK